MPKQLVARWRSRGGKYWLDLYLDQYGYTYRADDCGGSMGLVTEAAAFERIAQILFAWPSKPHREL